MNEKELLKLLDFERWRNAAPAPEGEARVGTRRLSRPDLRRLCAQEREGLCLAIERRRKRKLFPDEDWGEQRRRTRLRRALTRDIRRAKREHRFAYPKLWAGIWRLTVDPEGAIEWLFEPGPDPFPGLGGPPGTTQPSPPPLFHSNHEKPSLHLHPFPFQKDLLMKETNFQTQPVRERRPAFGSNTGPEPGHNARPRISLDSSPESVPAAASDRSLDGGLGPASLDAFAPARRQLYAEALKACHLEKRRGFRELVRGTDPKRDAAPAIRPVPDDQPRSHGRCSRYQSCGRRPPEANAARLLDYLQGDPWQPGVPRPLEPESEELGQPNKLGKEEPKAQAGAPVPPEPHRNIQDRPVTSLNFESQPKEKAPRVTRPLAREPQTPALLNFESLIKGKARENAPEAETEAKAEAKELAPGLSESPRRNDPQPSALPRGCEPRDGSAVPKVRPQGLAHFFALCKRLVRKFL